jgi:hypothetical protein
MRDLNFDENEFAAQEEFGEGNAGVENDGFADEDDPRWENITEEEAALADKYAREGISVSYDMLRAAAKVAKARANAGGDAGASTSAVARMNDVVANVASAAANVAGASEGAAVHGAGTVEECTCEVVCTCGLNC